MLAMETSSAPSCCQCTLGDARCHTEPLEGTLRLWAGASSHLITHLGLDAQGTCKAGSVQALSSSPPWSESKM